jgi:hypothetical protein
MRVSSSLDQQLLNNGRFRSLPVASLERGAIASGFKGEQQLLQHRHLTGAGSQPAPTSCFSVTTAR